MSQSLTPQGSNRRYFREQQPDGSTVIRVEGVSRRENHAFVTMARHFQSLGLPTPRVLWVSDDEMQYTQQDLGDVLLYEYLSSARATGQFSPDEVQALERTMRALAHMHVRGGVGLDWSVCYPVESMDRRSVFWDLNYFKYCFLRLLGLEIDEPRLEDDFCCLGDSLLAVPQDYLMLRDCQSRNVMLLDGQPYFIDFQGGRRGPVQYDLASFLWQARLGLSDALRKHLMLVYLSEHNRLLPAERSLTLEQLEAGGVFPLFRTLQVLGAYGLRGLHEGRPHFLQSIPQAKQNLRHLFALYPDLQTHYPYLYVISQNL